MRSDENLPGLIGQHPLMRELFRWVRVVAPTDAPVLIKGETGTGKELIARAVHGLSACAHGPFVAVNCAAIPETLAEGELFGVERGAFTDARETRPGRVQVAHGGTLYLDEVCSMPPSQQAKLLRVMESGEYWRVGGVAPRYARVRFIASVSESPAALTAAGRLREDFLYRIAVAEVEAPPLRRRRADIRLLVHHFLSVGNGHAAVDIEPAAIALLQTQPWPGNVRQLRAAVERLRLFAQGDRITAATVRQVLPAPALSATAVAEALAQAGGSVRGAARALGVPRTTLQRWLEAARPSSLTIVG
jgi:DNA-binding NtrC family response regulator